MKHRFLKQTLEFLKKIRRRLFFNHETTFAQPHAPVANKNHAMGWKLAGGATAFRWSANDVDLAEEFDVVKGAAPFSVLVAVAHAAESHALKHKEFNDERRRFVRLNLCNRYLTVFHTIFP
jgi:hypothetical protein